MEEIMKYIRRLPVAMLLLFISSALTAQGLSISAEADKDDMHGESVIIRLTEHSGASNYTVFSSGPDNSWIPHPMIPADSFKAGWIKDTIHIENYVETSFRVEASDSAGAVVARAESSNKVTTHAKWFNYKRTNKLIAILFISAMIIYYIERAKKAKEIYLRPIAGLKAFEEAVGRATEMGKSVLYVPGIQDLDQVETIAGVIILGHVSKMTARYETDLNVPVARSLVMEASREIVHESYLGEGRPDLYNPDIVHYLTDDQFAFAAGVNGIMIREKPAALFFQGKFFAESLILAETGNSIGAIQIAGTASPAQIPFFVTACDYTLIGEEFFAASAYLGKDPKLMGSIKGQDIGKALIMLSIGLGVILQTFGFTAFRELFRVM